MMTLSTPFASTSSQQKAVLYQHDPAQDVAYFHLLFTNVTEEAFTYQNVTKQSNISCHRAKPHFSSNNGLISHDKETLEAMLKSCIYNGKAADGLVWVPQEIPLDKDFNNFIQNKCFLRGRTSGRKICGALAFLIFISLEKEEDKEKVRTTKGLSKSFCRGLYQEFISKPDEKASSSCEKASRDSDDEKSPILVTKGGGSRGNYRRPLDGPSARSYSCFNFSFG